MDSFEKEPNCEHHRIPRNCYLCYLHRNDYDPTKKTTMDTLYETISELKIRITKLEQYARLQADHNNLQREINLTLNAHYTQTCRELNVLQEHRKKQIDENRDLGDRIAILEREIVDIKIYSHPMQEKVWQQNISTRIEQLEQTNQQAIDANPIKDIYELLT